MRRSDIVGPAGRSDRVRNGPRVSMSRARA
jgi:hypothetical protein